MVGGIFYEHSHRLLGALVGLLTLALAAALWPRGRLACAALGLVAVAVVIVQGVLGGLRVVLLKDTLAIVHGCLAQAFFALLVPWPLADLASAARAAVARARAGTSRALAAGAAGARLPADRLRRAAHPRRLASTCTWRAPWPCSSLVPDRDRPAARGRRSRWRRPWRACCSSCSALQLLLGVGSYLSRFSPIWIPGGQLTMLALPVAHRLVGSLILAAAVVLAVRVRRRRCRGVARGAVPARRLAAGTRPR